MKEPCKGKVHVGFMGLEGDEVADRLHHGGIHKALFANSYENYLRWSEFLAFSSLPYGALGENLTLSGLYESSVMLGDIYTIGLSGWYYIVLREGEIAQNDTVRVK